MKHNLLVKVLVIVSILTMLTVAAVTSWASYQIAEVKNDVYEVGNKNVNQLTKVQAEIAAIQTIIASQPKAQDGKTPACYYTASQCQGTNGVNGTNAVSTNTVVQVPVNGQNGTDGKQVELGQTASGVPVWRYVGDRTWQTFQIVTDIPDSAVSTVNTVTNTVTSAVKSVTGDRDGQ